MPLQAVALAALERLPADPQTPLDARDWQAIDSWVLAIDAAVAALTGDDVEGPVVSTSSQR